MNSYHDPELEDVLQDDELRHMAAMLSSARMHEPPLDDAFRTGLRRQLMQDAWAMSEGRDAWWRRLFAPPGLAWAGATAGLLLIASVVVWFAVQPAGGLNTVYVGSPIDGNRNVPLQQPILVAFNQPMDHQTTQDAVHITPATSVAFSWDQQSRTLAVQPVVGNLAPNTQYQVTIGAGARTQAGQPLATPQTITFVTQPPASPTPPATPRPTPANPLGEKQLVTLNGATALTAQWSPDSSSLYFVDGKGALLVVPAKGGSAAVIAPDGASSPSISPTGDRLAYLRGGRIEVLTFATGKTDEISAKPTPILVGWLKDKVVWAGADGIYTQGADGTTSLASLPSTGTVSVLSIAPDGAHVIYRQDSDLFVLDLTGGKSTPLGQANAAFAGWSPSGAFLMYASGDAITVADPQGAAQATIPLGEASWSSQDAVLVGSDTELYQLWADGTGGTKLASGTYHFPLWAPNGTSFAFVRGNNLWAGVAPALAPKPTPLDEAAKVVTAFMDARLKGQANEATQQLDESGKKAYGEGGLSLLITGDPHFTRYYVLTQGQVATQPDTVRVVVRLVLSHGKLDVSSLEETLTLVREAKTRLFFIDQASQAGRHDLGKGAEVVGVEVTADTVKVTFDSDLDPGTVSDGIQILDAKGKQVDATTTYSNRTFTLSGLDLKGGGHYRLVVLTTVRDVLGHNVAAEYDLDLVGPAVKKHGSHSDVATPTPAASPSPSPTG
ncbi:MAG TPA: Ig-like domain-containing protein [Candidatus Dormibacteraeota bacterium]|nr:Ig-like domain-containing protein [Candidatus Dormibacteraeota bacterium]